MKHLVAITLLTILFTNNYAQVSGGQHSKLFDLFILEKYEDVLFKAGKMTESDKYSGDAEVYLYMAMALLEIHKNIDQYDQDVYKKPLVDALKECAKAVKKDKDEVIIPENEGFIAELKAEAIRDAESLYFNPDYRKAAGVYKRIVKIDEADENLLFMLGACEMMSKNVGEGSKHIDEAIAMIEEKYADSSYETDEVSIHVLVQALVDYSEFLKTEGDLEGAKKIIGLGYKYLGTDEKIKAQYSAING